MTVSKYLKRSRLFYGFINLAFNQYDSARVKSVGPDTAAAEWVVKNEGWVKGLGHTAWVKDFNGLSSCYGPRFKLTHIEAVDRDVTSGGCKHFDGLKHVKYLNLRDCVNIDDSGLRVICKNCWNSLKYLDIAGTSITIRGLELVTEFEALQTLKYDEKLTTNTQKHDDIIRRLMERDGAMKDIEVIK